MDRHGLTGILLGHITLYGSLLLPLIQEGQLPVTGESTRADLKILSLTCKELSFVRHMRAVQKVPGSPNSIGSVHTNLIRL